MAKTTDLKRLLAAKEHSAFLAALSQELLAPTCSVDYLRALAGDGLCLILEQSEASGLRDFQRYGQMVLDGNVDAPAKSISSLGIRINSQQLIDLAESMVVPKSDPLRIRPAPGSIDNSDSESRPVILLKRVVNITEMRFGKFAESDGAGIRRSVFRSAQERTFLRALSLRFPGLLAFPNYPLDQIVDLERLRNTLNARTISYGKACRVDAVLVIPDEGDPIAAFELDSSIHNNRKARQLDEMKDRIFQEVGIPYFRLRAENCESTSIDDWYAILTDSVVQNIGCGDRIRSRKSHSVLVPFSSHL